MLVYESKNSPGSSSLSSENSAIAGVATAATTTPAIINSALKRQWGSEITVELSRDECRGFGISIIGLIPHKSKVSSLAGILIKKILPDSPAAKSGLLKTGDKLLEVDGVDLRNATHDEAVEVIKKAHSPVKFVVQSLIPIVSVPPHCRLAQPFPLCHLEQGLFNQRWLLPLHVEFTVRMEHVVE